MKRVLVYSPRVLPPSQTFVAEQTRALRRWHPVLAGRQLDDRGPDVRELLVPDGITTTGRLGVVRQRITRRVAHLESVIARTQPDLIHAHFLTGGIDVTMTVATLPCPLIVTGHGFDVTEYGELPRTIRPGRMRLGQLRRRLVLRPDVRFIAVSHFIAAELLALGADESRVVVHYTGIDTDYFRADPASPVVGAQPEILFVGRLVPKKGLRDLITAIGALDDLSARPLLRVIGDGPERRRLEVHAQHQRIAVRFEGSQPKEAVRDALRRATLLCVPSCTDPNGDREGLGMVFLEAQAMGVPVVATTSGGIPEAVLDGTTGLLVPERDVAQLSAALRACLTDPDLHRRLAEGGRPWVVRNFDLRRQTDRLETLYDAWTA